RPNMSLSTPPCVESNTDWTSLGVIVQPADGTWQLTHRRPLVPRSWKNSLPRSICPFPIVLTVVDEPVGLSNDTLLGRRLGPVRSITWIDGSLIEPESVSVETMLAKEHPTAVTGSTTPSNLGMAQYAAGGAPRPENV